MGKVLASSGWAAGRWLWIELSVLWLSSGMSFNEREVWMSRTGYKISFIQRIRTPSGRRGMDDQKWS